MIPAFDVVVPTVGRPCLTALLDALDAAAGPRPGRVLVVDDRPDRASPLPLGRHAGAVEVLQGAARGPAAARNVGWRASTAAWVAFLDDDVLPGATWGADLVDDLRAAGPDVAGVGGRLTVPLPAGRRPTDWERNVAGLESGRWITADLAFRRTALASVGGFDERFRRAFREDADLAARLVAAGWRLETGRRSSEHPVRPADRWVSVRLQAGNADDPRLRLRYGRRWREVTGVHKGRRARHLAVTGAGLLSVAAGAARRRSVAGAAAAVWVAGTAELAWARIAPGPRTADEVATMVVTSVALPPAATWHWLRGWVGLATRG
jgi:cellulose synthase/poly-beta-1,6-N-acetylglucosamine synthase-like glycosyltransferase